MAAAAGATARRTPKEEEEAIVVAPLHSFSTQVHQVASMSPPP